MISGVNIANSSTIIVLVVYFAILLSIGFIAGRRVKNSEDYAVGGHDVPGWAAALSERATDMSAYMALGLPGGVYLSGMLGLWPAIGSVIGRVKLEDVRARSYSEVGFIMRTSDRVQKIR